MNRSFRLRMALLSALLAGAVLAVFAGSAWWLMLDMKTSRLDHDLREQAEREAGKRRNADGWQAIEGRLAASFGVRSPRELLLLVEDSDGGISYRSAHWPAQLDAGRFAWPAAHARAAGEDRPEAGPPRRDDDASPSPGTPPVATVIAVEQAGRHWRIGLAATDRARVAVAIDSAAVQAEMAGVRNALLLSLPLALLMIGTGSWLFSGSVLRPLRKLTGAAQSLTAAGLDRRLSSAGEDREFVELIEVFNGMLERLERSFMQANRFSADAAHELRTPLAILQGQLERAINAAEAGSQLQRDLADILDEVRRLAGIARKLLLLSRADAGRLTLHREAFDLSDALASLVDDVQMLAPELGVTAAIQPGIVVQADGDLMRQVLHNLLSNAIKYNIPDGWIRIGAGKSSGRCEVRVANASPGIPPEQRQRIFERFYRADSARGRQVDGVGLGLALAREIVRAHGGEITCRVAEDGAVEFRIDLPG